MTPKKVGADNRAECCWHVKIYGAEAAKNNYASNFDA